MNVKVGDMVSTFTLEGGTCTGVVEEISPVGLCKVKLTSGEVRIRHIRQVTKVKA